MAKILHHKVVVALPLPLEPDSIYYVRKGDGFDIHVTNGAGVVTAYSLNADVKLDGKVDKADIAQVTGSDTDKVMSQKAVTELIGDVEAVLIAINGEP